MSTDTGAFSITRANWAKPILWAVGTTSSRSYVRVDQNWLHARFSFYTLEIPVERIRCAERSTWPWYGGIGIRSNLRNTLALVGSYDNIVRLDIDPPIATSVLLIPIRVMNLYLSLDDPGRFLETVADVRAGGARIDPR